MWKNKFDLKCAEIYKNEEKIMAPIQKKLIRSTEINTELNEKSKEYSQQQPPQQGQQQRQQQGQQQRQQPQQGQQQFQQHIHDIETKYHTDKKGQFKTLWPELAECLL